MAAGLADRRVAGREAGREGGSRGEGAGGAQADGGRGFSPGVSLMVRTITVIGSGMRFPVEVERLPDSIVVRVDGERFEVPASERPAIRGLAPSQPTPGDGLTSARPRPVAERTRQVRAQLPGLILEVKVSEGDDIHRGQLLCVLDAMKMENAVTAPYDGHVTAVRVGPREQVRHGQVLVEYTVASSG
jgi:glutaconyl-CoA/methylmalonyl-CoA decarboxylase subunit gamma